MPKASFTDETFDWSHLVTGIEERAGELEALVPKCAELKALLARVHKLAARKRHLVSEQRRVSRELRESLDSGRELAGRLRGGLKLAYGVHSEDLYKFGVRPRRQARNKAKPQGEESPEVPS